MNKIEVVSLSKQSRSKVGTPTLDASVVASGSKRFEKLIQKLARKILKVLNKNNVLVEIYLINGRKMRFLNKKFRGQDKTTTILSFEEPRNFILPASRFRKVGEIYLNAEDSSFPPRARLAKGGRLQISRLLIHGLLHLFNYNHQKKNGRIKMERLENLVIRELGN